MKEKIEAKVKEIIDYIVNKPIEEVTIDDYSILTNELKDIRFAESQVATESEWQNSWLWLLLIMLLFMGTMSIKGD